MTARAGRTGYLTTPQMMWPFLAGLHERGFALDWVASRIDVPLAKLKDPDARIPYEAVVNLAALAVEVTKDPAFGLHVAERYVPGSFGVLDYLAHSSATLGEAIEHFCRYNRLLADSAQTRVERLEGGRVLVRQDTSPGFRRPREIVEHVLAQLIVVARELTGLSLAPIEVRFVHAKPEYSQEHARIFDAKVCFDADCDGALFDEVALDLPLPNANPGLCAILARHAEQLLAQIPASASFALRVRSLILEELRHGAPTMEVTAEKLKMSTRTLSRRLGDEATTYEAILDGLRRELSLRYLAEPTLSIGETALMLGYFGEHAFYRAFRRWFGQTPAQYRKNKTR